MFAVKTRLKLDLSLQKEPSSPAFLTLPTPQTRSFQAMASIFVPSNNPPIYKVCSQSVWESIRSLDEWTGSAHDERDGFIHFSAAHQLAGTVAKHFSGQTNLVLISIDPKRLGGRLRWEPSRDGDLFPHLYGPLSLNAVIESRELVLNDQGLIDGIDASC